MLQAWVCSLDVEQVRPVLYSSLCLILRLITPFISSGIGFLTPVFLNGLPVIGEVLAGISSGVRAADAQLGGLGQKAGRFAGQMKLPGNVSIGMGCGVALGYGWGAGVMLKHKPEALLSKLSKFLPGRSSTDECKLLTPGSGIPPANFKHDLYLNHVDSAVGNAHAILPKNDGHTLEENVPVAREESARAPKSISTSTVSIERLAKLEHRCRLLEMEVSDLKKRVVQNEQAISDSQLP